MKSFFSKVRLPWTRLLCGFLLAMAGGASAQWMQQSISLRPGWNAVYLEVHPEPEECDALFAGLPVESVWDYNRSVDSPQFVQDPSTLIPGAPGWLTWFPPNHPLGVQSSLFLLRDGRSYLVKLASNAPPTTLTVAGRPSLRKASWLSGALNLQGFHVGVQGPSFQTLFAGEPGLANQPVYTLDAQGVWRRVLELATTRAKAGEAYWIRCAQPAQRAGTITVDAGSSRGILFDAIVAEHSLRIRNTSTANRNISVKLLPSAAAPAGQVPNAGPVPLEYWRTDTSGNNMGWQPMPASLSFSALAVGMEWNIRLGVRRASSPNAYYQSLLEITDDAGTRWMVPISSAPARVNPAGFMAASEPNPHAGLWVGDVVLKSVSQPAHLSDPSQPRPAGGEFSFRLMMHVDAAGATRLLRQAYLVRKPPVYAPDPENPEMNRLEAPARNVVLTDESLLSAIIGPGEITGRRLSSPAFAFKEPMTLTGGGFGAGVMTAVVNLDYDHPLNPFKHRFHPDHNNLDERFEQKLPEGKESFTVTRAISLEFTATDPMGLNPPSWGDSELGGVYRETFTGLHRHPIQVSGTFRLVRTSRAAALNQ